MDVCKWTKIICRDGLDLELEPNSWDESGADFRGLV